MQGGYYSLTWILGWSMVKVIKYMLWWDYKGWDDRYQKDKYVDNRSSKKIKIDQSNCLNSSLIK